MQIFGFDAHNKHLTAFGKVPAAADKNWVGGKAASLLTLCQLGLPVPPAFIFTTDVWRTYQTNAVLVLNEITGKLPQALTELMAAVGGEYMPLVSVRSGAPVSCPGMMDTLLNVGLDTDTYGHWEKRLGKPAAITCLRRLMASYIELVLRKNGKVPAKHKSATALFEWFATKFQQPWPKASEQMLAAILAVLRSWDNDRAKTYRKLHGISDDLGTAVIVQAMVFGNLNDKSCTGVLFTRNPDTGSKVIMGEFLPCAQGEDVVAGTHTPLPFDDLSAWNPQLFSELVAHAEKLEQHAGYPQDIEFTVEDGKLWLLQTRDIKRTPKAAARIALDMQDLKRLTAKEYQHLASTTVDPAWKDPPAVTGLPACSGVVSGPVVNLSSKAKAGDILVTEQTNPNDIVGMILSAGILTMHGGATSHAAVIARGLNKPAVVGCGADLSTFKEGEIITIDGATGRVWHGAVPTVVADSTLAQQVIAAAYQSLKALPMAPTVVTADQALDISNELSTVEQVSRALELALAAKPNKLLVVSDPSPAQLSMYAMLGTSRERLAANLLGAVGMLPEEQQQQLALVRWAEMPMETVDDLQWVPTVDTLEALIVSGGDYVINPKLGNTAAIKQVMAWKAAEGHQARAIGMALPGTRSYLTVEEALSQALGS